jgi:hypothetical protein
VEGRQFTLQMDILMDTPRPHLIFRGRAPPNSSSTAVHQPVDREAATAAEHVDLPPLVQNK